MLVILSWLKSICQLFVIRVVARFWSLVASLYRATSSLWSCQGHRHVEYRCVWIGCQRWCDSAWMETQGRSLPWSQRHANVVPVHGPTPFFWLLRYPQVSGETLIKEQDGDQWSSLSSYNEVYHASVVSGSLVVLQTCRSRLSFVSGFTQSSLLCVLFLFITDASS